MNMKYFKTKNVVLFMTTCAFEAAAAVSGKVWLYRYSLSLSHFVLNSGIGLAWLFTDPPSFISLSGSGHG